jgi:hypothetical protein
MKLQASVLSRGARLSLVSQSFQGKQLYTGCACVVQHLQLVQRLARCPSIRSVRLRKAQWHTKVSPGMKAWHEGMA